MRVRNAVSVAAGLAVALSAPAGAQERYSVGGSEVAIYNLAGQVEVVGGSGSDVVVEVMRGGSDAEQLTVEVGEVRGRETLRVIYPADRVVYERRGGGNTELRVNDDGTFGGGRGGDRVQVSGSGRGLEAYADLRITVPAGKDVAVYLAAGEINASDVSSDLRLDTHSGAVEARGIRGDLLVDTGSGSVVVEEVAGAVNVDTGSGSVTINDVNGGDVRVDTGSGGVRGSNITAGSVNVDTGSGGVELFRVGSADVYVDTGSGSVEVEITTDIDRLEVDTGSGSVTVRMPADVGASVEVETGSGGIDVDLPLQIRSVRRDYLRGEIGDGRGTIVIDTGSGSIRLLSSAN
jgi:hypothetical protein